MNDPAAPSSSPFQQRGVRRLNLTTMLLLLITVVAAGIALLIAYALRVPAIVEELNAMLGITTQPDRTTNARATQVVFAMFTYTAPLALGILVYTLHHAINWLERRRQAESPDEEEFRMN